MKSFAGPRICDLFYERVGSQITEKAARGLFSVERSNGQALVDVVTE